MYVTFTNLCFIINICIIPHAFPALLIMYFDIKISFKISFSMLIKTYFDQKVPWNFLQSSMALFDNIWRTPVVPWNSMELQQQNPKFHEIPWNFVQIQSAVEFHGIVTLPARTMEFHGIPWNLINLFFFFTKTIFLNIVVGIWLMLICYLAQISQKRHILHWFWYSNSYFEHPSVSENGTRSAKMACCLKQSDHTPGNWFIHYGMNKGSWNKFIWI